jgi:phosphonopyruvate decarboxylase
MTHNDDTAAGGRALVSAMRGRDYAFFTGVPCSLLKTAIAALEGAGDYLPAVREDAAVGMAAGAAMGGRKAAVFMQNSGLGVSLNALASLSVMYELPALLVVSWRGHGPDAPEHALTGRITPKLLELLGTPTLILEPATISEQVREADDLAQRLRRPVALLVREGVLA